MFPGQHNGFQELENYIQGSLLKFLYLNKVFASPVTFLHFNKVFASPTG